MRVENAGKKMQFFCFIIIKLDWIGQWSQQLLKSGILQNLNQFFGGCHLCFLADQVGMLSIQNIFESLFFFRFVEENLF